MPQSSVCDCFVCNFSSQRGRPGRIPLPPEVSRERRRITKAKSREKEKAKKKQAEEEARERSERERLVVNYTEIDEDEEEMFESRTDDDGGGSSEPAFEATDEKKTPRKRKAVSYLPCVSL